LVQLNELPEIRAFLLVINGDGESGTIMAH